MDTPDKIYATESHHGWYETNEGGNKIEYVRKSALLKWVQEELSKTSVSSSSIGRRNAFIDVIDKLNSM